MTSRFRFDRFAEMIAERIDDPSSSGLERYVGLEHLDPEAIDIKRWGSPADVTSTKFRFYPGDVIYGRRRAYQRKAGLANFNGLASAHALVLRAVAGVCDPAYLAYMLVSESFTRVAVGISVGSLSPTINWRDLRLQEFNLPSLHEQHRVVEVMRAVDQGIAAAEQVEANAAKTLGSLVGSLTKEDAPPRPLSEVLALRTAGAWGDGNQSEKRPVKVRVITNGDIRQDGSISGFATRWFSEREVSRFALSPGDVLMTSSGDVGKTALINPEIVGQADEPLSFSNFVHLLRPSASVSALYLYAQTRYGSIQRDIERMSSGSVLSNLNVDFYRRATIRVPSRLAMEALESRISILRSTEISAQSAIQCGRALRTSLFRELIG